MIAWLRSFTRYLRLRTRYEAEVDEEFRTHIELRAADLVRAGRSPHEARRRARAEFGGMEKYKEEGRQARGVGFRGAMLLDVLLSDLRYACRGLRKARGASSIAVLAIALGIGLPTVMYSVVHGVVDMELPYEDGDRIVSLVDSNRGGTLATSGEYLALRESQRSLEDLAAYRTEAVTLRSAELASRHTGGVITASMLDLLATPPILGRGFTPGDDVPGAPLTVLIDRRVWEDEFGSDPGVLGRTVTLNGETGEVIGVMENGWGLLFPNEQHLWMPLRLDAPASRELIIRRNLDSEGYSRDLLIVVGKLRQGVTLEQADSEIAAIAPSTRESSDDDYAIAGVRRFTDAIMPNAPMMFYPLLAAVMPVLLIACANVANLLLARTAARSKDIAMRTAIGASRARAVSQVMAEALVLSAVGSVLATGIAWTGIDMVRRAFSAATGLPSWLAVELDPQVLAFIVALTGLTALISGAIPAWRVTSADVGSVLKDGSGALAGLGIGRLSRALIVAEVTMSITLLVVASQMIRGFVAITQRELPVPAAEVYTARVAPLAQRFPDATMRQLLWEDVEARVGAVPGVRSVAITTSLPALGSASTPFMREGDTYATEREVPRARWSAVSAGFFATLGTAPLQGRTFDTSDSREATPVIVVNETFVRRFLEGQPIGRRIRVGGLDSDAQWREVVGVVPDLYMAGVANANPAAEAGFYVPLAQDDATSPYLVATTSGNTPLGISDAVRSAVSEADADTPVYSVATLRVLIDSDSDNTAFTVFGMLFIVFGVAALFMASAGLYAVTSFSVTRRVPELGLRMAVGASAAQVRRLVLGQGMRLVGIGTVLGSALSGLVDLGPLSEFFGTAMWDPMTYALVFALLSVASLLATALPARRATRLDPMTALRAS